MLNSYQISFNQISANKNYAIDHLCITFIGRNGSIIRKESDKSYRDTNQFLNNLHEDEEFKKFVLANYSYDGVCHWQFFVSYVWTYFFFCIESTNILSDFIKDNKIARLEYTKDDSIYSSIFYNFLADFCKKNGICFDLGSKKSSIFLRFFKKLKKILGSPYRQIEFLVLLICFRNKSPKPQRSENNILIFSQALYLEKREGKLVDRQVDTIYKCLLQSLSPTLIFSGLNDLLGPLKGHKINYLDYKNFYYFADPLVFIKLKLFNYIQLLKPKDIGGLHDIYYKGINIKNSVNIIFDYIKNNIFKETIFCRLSCRRLIDKLKPQAIYLTYETGPVQRAAIIEAARKKIPTYGLQHGMVFSSHYDYMHSLVTQNYGEFGFNIPTKTLVWGNFWKDMLIKSGQYPIDSVIVSGDWRSPKLIASSCNSPGNNRSILILTNGVQSQHFISTIRNVLIDCTLFYRPHPSEKENVKELDLKNLKLIEGSLEYILKMVDIVIAPLSTVILDSIHARKSTILFNHTATKGWEEEFRNIEGCFYTETTEELEKTFKKLINLSSEEQLCLQNKLEKSSQEFYAGDQKSALEKILSLLKTQNETERNILQN